MRLIHALNSGFWAFNPEIIVIWATAIATLGVYSILYRENRLSRLFEHLFVGLSMGWLLAIAWTLNLRDKWWLPMLQEGRWYWIFAPVVGLLFYLIYSRRLSWLARLVMGLFFGLAAGQFFRGFFPLYWPQVTSSFKPLRPDHAGGLGTALRAPLLFISSWGDVLLHNWLFVLILLTVMSYFFFSIRHDRQPGRTVGGSAALGRWFLMIAFGAMFGNTVMARLSLFIGRVQFLLGDWIGHYWRWLAQRMM